MLLVYISYVVALRGPNPLIFVAIFYTCLNVSLFFVKFCLVTEFSGRSKICWVSIFQLIFISWIWIRSKLLRVELRLGALTSLPLPAFLPHPHFRKSILVTDLLTSVSVIGNQPLSTFQKVLFSQLYFLVLLRKEHLDSRENHRTLWSGKQVS